MSDELTPPVAELAQASPTAARIGLGITGPSIPTREHLRFQLDHALARDAVHAQMDVDGLLEGLRQRQLDSLVLRSSAADGTENDRRIYLRRPDLGRRLHPASEQVLRDAVAGAPTKPDIVLILADGLSALAVNRHALALVDALLPLFHPDQLSIGPVCLVQQGRVAIGDAIGGLLDARLSLVLIGERPGLSAADSLGAYLTWNPRPGRTDAERNCVSNIRLEGLSYFEAARKIAFYVHESRRIQATGVLLKEGALPALQAPSKDSDALGTRPA